MSAKTIIPVNLQMLLFLSKDDLTLPTKAIHNKDYSVVKTFKAGLLGVSSSVLWEGGEFTDFFSNFASLLNEQNILR